MRPSTFLVVSSVALSSVFLVPMWYAALANAADQPNLASTPPATPTATSPTPAMPPSSVKATLDESSEDDFPASSRLVRDLVAAHPSEDLVICVAGCKPGIDRVIYAQPADPLAKRTNVAAQQHSEPSSPPSEQVGEQKDNAAASDTPSVSAEPAPDAPVANNDAPAGSSGSESRMEPTGANVEPSTSEGDSSSDVAPSQPPSDNSDSTEAPPQPDSESQSETETPDAPKDEAPPSEPSE